MTNALCSSQTKFLDNHIANQIPFEGLERARGGRLLFLLHQPHVRHQVLFFQPKQLPLQSESQGLLHQDAGRLRQWDPGHYGQICREVATTRNHNHTIATNATTAKRFFHFDDLGIDHHIRLKEVDQVSADILNEQVGVSKLNGRYR